jgi:hypothetical protein
MMGTLGVAEDGLGRCQRQMGVQSRSQTSAQDSCPFISQEIGTGLVDLPQNKDTSSMVIALGLNICICHQKHGKDDNNNVPSREDQPELVCQTRHVGKCIQFLTRKFLPLHPCFQGYTKRRKQPLLGFGGDKLEARMLSRSPYYNGSEDCQKTNGEVDAKAYLSAIFPFRANEIAFMNSVVFGTRANRVTPRNFSSMPEFSKITSTTSTNSSGHRGYKDPSLQKSIIRTSNYSVKKGAS